MNFAEREATRTTIDAGDEASETLDRLRGYPAEVEVWLNDLIEARHPDTDPRQLDDVLSADGNAAGLSRV